METELLQPASLIFARIAAAVLVMPMIGCKVIPVRFRLSFAILLTIVVMPLLWQTLPHSLTTAAWTDAVLKQVAIGAAMGFGVQIIVLGCSMAGGWISDISGMGAATTGSQSQDSPSLSGLFRWFAIIAFISIGGLGRTVTAVLDSFRSIPVSGQLQVDSLFQLMVDVIQQSFLLAIKIGAPAIACVMLATIVVSLLSRTVTGSNLFQFQLAGNWLVALFMIATTLAGSLWLMGARFDAMLNYVGLQIGVAP